MPSVHVPQLSKTAGGGFLGPKNMKYSSSLKWSEKEKLKNFTYSPARWASIH